MHRVKSSLVKCAPLFNIALKSFTSYSDNLFAG